MIEEGVELARLTTIGTGGPGSCARAAATPWQELEQALRWARGAAAWRSSRSASARTCSRPTTASTRSSCASRVSSRRRRRTAACSSPVAAPTNAVCLHRARAAGLGGFEFACAIPGTAGGGVWMNAGAYGSDWAAILERALVATADGAAWLTPSELGLSYRHSDLQHGQVVARVEYRLDAPGAEPRSRPRSPTSSRGGRRRSRRTSGRSDRSSRIRPASSAQGGCSSSAA